MSEEQQGGLGPRKKNKRDEGSQGKDLNKEPARQRTGSGVLGGLGSRAGLGILAALQNLLREKLLLLKGLLEGSQRRPRGQEVPKKLTESMPVF